MPKLQTYIVTGKLRGDIRSTTRRQAGSAMVVADRWADQGGQDITLTDLRGIVRSREQFRPGLLTDRYRAKGKASGATKL